MRLLDELESRQRFGMKPGLEAMRDACVATGHPEKKLRGVIHVAGTNGKGAVCAMLDACLRAGGYRVGCYTSPHLVRVNERFFLDGAPVSDALLDSCCPDISSLTYFEYLTLVAFELYSRTNPDFTILETGLGGRLDATNVCAPTLAVITRIGLDHCDWLGDTVEKIAAEKAGIVKLGVPIVLGKNLPAVRAVVESRSRAVGAPFHYAPDLVDERDVPADFALAGSFNRENAVTALAALRCLFAQDQLSNGLLDGFANVVWPGRFQRIGDFIVDGAHNPPAAHALAQALADAGFAPRSLALVCGFCGDKDVDEVLHILAPFVAHGYAVQTNNPRSLAAEETTTKLVSAGIPSTVCPSLGDALAQAGGARSGISATLVAGSLFLAGEALVALGAMPGASFSASRVYRFDASERIRPA